ncbi:MAG: S6e family ribosomal protein [Candidatus Geothermarchaeales archaeon]
MVKFKLNIANPKEDKTTSMEIDEPKSLALLNKKIGDVIEGAILGLEGKKLRITGGSDSSGIPMRTDVHGGVRKPILLSGGVGMRSIKRKGLRKRKVIRGNTITRDIWTINLVVLDS